MLLSITTSYGTNNCIYYMFFISSQEFNTLPSLYTCSTKLWFYYSINIVCSPIVLQSFTYSKLWSELFTTVHTEVEIYFILILL